MSALSGNPSLPASTRWPAGSALTLSGISKSYGGVKALIGVNLEVSPGEVHALMGENGAGKSTLIKIAAGVVRPEGGAMTIGQKEFAFGHPSAVRHGGLQVVFQELTVLDNLTVAHNLLIDALPARWGLLDRRAGYNKAQQILDDLSIDIDVRTPAAHLSVGQKQLVEIARSVAREPKVLILDEPTSSLGRDEEMILFDIVRRLRADGVGLVYVSHRMSEVFDLADRITVLRDGKLISTVAASETSREGLIRTMVGRDVADLARQTNIPGAPVLEVTGMTKEPMVRGVNITLCAGEIVGVAGLMGAGRTELARLLCGADRPDKGTMMLRGVPFAPTSIRKSLRSRVVYVPEDRKTLGLVLGMSIEDNIALPVLRNFTRGGLLRRTSVRDLAELWVAELRIKASRTTDDVTTLSGGNQQKVALAKWLMTRPEVILLDEPTRGVDVGAKAEIHGVIRQLATQGACVMVISSELPEILALSDRIVVMAGGRVSGILNADEATEESVLSLAFDDSHRGADQIG